LDVGGKIGTTGFAFRLPILYEKDINWWPAYESRTQDLAPSVSYTTPNGRVSVVAEVEEYKKSETPPLAEYPNLGDATVYPGLPANFNLSGLNDYRISKKHGGYRYGQCQAHRELDGTRPLWKKLEQD